MVTPDGRLGWGLVGCGWVAADYVAPAIRGAANGRLAAVHDLDRDAMGRVARDGGCRIAYNDLDSMLADPGVQAVYVATPNHTHPPIVEAAARAGKHVLCEKPMATTVEAARAMVRACERAGVTYATAFDQRYHSAHRKLRTLVADGTLGVVTQARIHYACWLPGDWSADNWRVDPRRAGGGALIDLAPHGVDLLEMILGDQWADLVALKQSKVHAYAVDDGAVLAGRFRGGALATIHVAYNCPEAFPRRALEVIGTRALALAVDTMGQTPGGTLTLIDGATGARVDATPPAAEDRSPFLLQVEAFGRSILAGEAYPFPPADDLRTFEALEAACR